MRNVDNQVDRLRAVHPWHPVVQFHGEPDLMAMLLPDGGQLLAVNGRYDLWHGHSTAITFGLTLKEAQHSAYQDEST
jgi:hypothetical protein